MLVPAHKPYRPYGAVNELFYCKAPEVLIEGPAGTGKSRGALEKLFILAEKYAGCRILLARKTRSSMTQSTLVTFEEKVIPSGHSCLRGARRDNRSSYNFANGSEVVITGLDNPERLMSAEYDVIFFDEAIETTEDDFEKASSRLRNFVIPYQQMVLSVNPERPSHWINRRFPQKATSEQVRLYSRHEDNPMFWADGDWTENGLKYIARLDNLTGARKQRLRFGKWAGAEGLCYSEWEPSTNIIQRADVPKAIASVIWVVDFGFTNPFVWQEYLVDHDGRAYLSKEIYRSQVLVEDHAKAIRAASDLKPSAIVCDHDAEGRATLEKYLGMRTIPAKKEVTVGIEKVNLRLRKQGDGKPRFFVVADCLIGEDAVLREERKPISSLDEVDGYVWDIKEGKNPKEAPVKTNDHGMDAWRYLSMYLDLPRKAGWGDFNEAHATS